MWCPRRVARVGRICSQTAIRVPRYAKRHRESAAQIPDSDTIALTLTHVTSQPNDSRWQRPDDSAAPTPVRPASASLVDPEDDLPSATYAGDFETTVIPHHDSSDSSDSSGVRSSSSGYGLIGGQEPLPYQPQASISGRHSAFGPEAIDEHQHHPDDERVRAAARRGTQHLGLLILRVGLGAVLLAHGLQKLFGWWGGQGLNGFKNSLSGAGYQHADILTYCAAGGEIAAGVLLVLGLFTPLAAAGALAYLTNSLLAGMSAQHSGHGGRSFPYFLPNGHEYEITLIVMATAVILVGPGRYGFDAGRGWARRPFIGSFVALLVGIGAGVALWILLNGANPVG
jgi:putative oxidoreductase